MEVRVLLGTSMEVTEGCDVASSLSADLWTHSVPLAIFLLIYAWWPAGQRAQGRFAVGEGTQCPQPSLRALCWG